MGLREDIKNVDKYNESDRRDFQILLDRYLECDKWANNVFKDVGVLLTSHPGNRAFLKASVETHKKLGYWLTLVYDNYFDPKNPGIEWNHIMPDRDVIDIVDTFVMPHNQTWGGVLYPYFWLLKFGLATMSGFKYIFCSNGDCIIEKPENFPQIIDMLGDNDIIACGWERDFVFNSTSFLGKSEAIRAIMEHVQENFIPLEAYERTKQDFGNCEARMGKAILDLGLKIVKVKNPYNTQLHKKGYGTWYEILGFRHIHAEWGYAYKYHTLPPELKYIDKRHMGAGEYDVVEKYYETGDEKVLEDWWWKG